ncbi:MAG: NYN domain-containing protein, partial [Pyrinomonadaceae bacterium]
MPYLIDGNNLMWRGQTRRELLDELAQFAAAKKARVAVAFDGAPEANFPDNSTFKSVKIYYHERGSNADARIKSLVESSKERQTLFVVTSDRALADFIRRTGAKVINCRDFRQKMENLPPEKKQTASEVVKPEEMKEWLR